MITRRGRNSENNQVPRHRFSTAWKVAAGCCLALACYFLLTPAQGSTHTLHRAKAPSTAITSPTLQVDLGFDSMYRVGYWMPVHVSLSSGNSDFTGKISISTLMQPPKLSNTITSTWSFEEPVTLAKQSKKQMTLSVPLYPGNNTFMGIIARLRNQQGKVVASQTVTDENEVLPGSLLIGVLADSNEDFDPLNRVYLPSLARPIILSTLDAGSMPAASSLLESFDVIILDNFDTRTLHPDQLLALQSWVNRGGILIEIGGSQWQRTLQPLPTELLPIALHGTQDIPAGTQLFSMSDPLLQDYEQQALAEPLPNAFTASTASIRQQSAFSGSEALISYDTVPLVVRAQQGSGFVYYLAIDPGSTEMVNWDGDNSFWRMLLTHALGDSFLIFSPQESYNTGPGQLATRAGILDMVEPETLPGPAVILLFLFGYALILGPIRLYILHRKKQLQKWNWPIILSIVAIFTLLSYELTFYQRSASIIDNSISIVRVNQGGTSASVTTYSGIYVPSTGDFTLHQPGEDLAQPIANQYMLNNPSLLSKKDVSAAISEGTQATDLTLRGLGSWTLHQTLTEQDVRLQGGIVTHLALNDHRLEGTIQNTLPTTLHDVYVLLPHNFVPIGDVGAGETQHINLPLSGKQSQPWESLADQIAGSNGLPESYFPYAQKQHPQSEEQRHMALLSALSGAGFTFPPCKGSCQTDAIINRDTIYVTGGRVPNPNMNNYEPLLEAGTQATLIGWADQSLTDDVTINGWRPFGRHESMIQMPLNISIASPLNVPTDFIAGHVIGIQSYDAELRLTGIYAMTAGTLTFELVAPDMTNLHVRSMTITEPDLWAHPFGAGTGLLTSHLQALLYNWQRGGWDTITLNQDKFTTSNLAAYIGPSGRILVQVANKDMSQGSLYFGEPSLSLN